MDVAPTPRQIICRNEMPMVKSDRVDLVLRLSEINRAKFLKYNVDHAKSHPFQHCIYYTNYSYVSAALNRY